MSSLVDCSIGQKSETWSVAKWSILVPKPVLYPVGLLRTQNTSTITSTSNST